MESTIPNQTRKLNQMKIAIFNTYDKTGGAAKAAHRLYSGLILLKQSVHYFVKMKTDLSDDNIEELSTFKKPMLFIDRLIQKYYITQNRTPISNTVFSITYAGVDIPSSKALKDADIINLHWVEKYLSLKSIQQLVDLGKPIVWTLHDEKAFTGGCHYTTGCESFKSDCSECIQLEKDPYHLAQKTLAAKYALLKDANISVITPSRWLAKQAQESMLFKNKEVVAIPNGIDTDIYVPLNKLECKKVLNIDPGSLVLQFGAQDNRELRKGFHYLIEAIEFCLKNNAFKQMCNENKIIILCVGEPSKEIEALPIQTKSVGYIDNDADMVKLYSATDIFILPSLEDNLPNTMIESLACKTPVIGFNTGGIPEVVNESNGRIVEYKNALKLSEAILELTFDDALREKLANSGHKLVNEKYTLSDQAKNYLAFFETLTKKKTTPQKKNSVDFDMIFDDLAGYAVRKETQHNHSFLADEAHPGASVHSNVELFSALDTMAQIKLTRHPLKKIKAYKKMLTAYYNRSR